MHTSNARILWLDAVRALAIVSVVACHSVEGVYALNLEFMSEVSAQSSLFAFTSFTFGRIGVPLFLFISGYLLLDRDWNKQSCIKFWKTRWLPLFLCVEAWVIIYFVFLYAIGHPFAIDKLLAAMLFVGKVGMGHFWYMPMIVGFYLFLPIMGAALKQLNPRTIAFPLIVIALYSFAVPIVQQMMVITDTSFELSTTLDMGFSGGVYGVYLILGWCVKRTTFNNIPSSALIGGIGIFFLACVAFQILSYQNNAAYNIWYNNGILLLCGLCLFELMSRMPNPWFMRTKEVSALDSETSLQRQKTLLGNASFCLSYYSFAIYLVHYPICLFLLPYFKLLPMALPFQTIAVDIATLLASLAISWMIAKIPWVGKKLLYLK